MANLKNVMDKYFANFTIDDNWLRKLTTYYYKLFTKDENTLSFFGDGLWGVYKIYFVPEDVNNWFDDVLEIDDTGLKKEVLSLEEVYVKGKVSTDIVNLTLCYVVHRILNTNLAYERKERYATYCLNILHYKFLSSLQNRKFKYGVDKSIALAVYSRLSRKFMIKVYGSWKELIDQRAKDIISKKSIHYKTLVTYDNDDNAVGKMVNEIQNRVRKMINALTDEFYKVREQDKTIGVSSKIISDEEGERVGESISQYKIYRRYIQNNLGDRNSLVKKEILDIIDKSSSRLPNGALEEVLFWISDNSYSSYDEKINEWLDNLLEYSFSVINDSKLKTNQLTQILIKLRAMFLSSRVFDKKLVDAKEEALKMVELGSKFSNKSVLVTLRSSVMLYMVLRTLTMKHYS